jgi:dsRNA-specific ribonuclease
MTHEAFFSFNFSSKTSAHICSALLMLLASGQTLSLIATKLELSNLIILGSGELKSGGHNRKSIQSDAVEAILGAIKQCL